MAFKVMAIVMQQIKTMDELEQEDIEAYGCSIPEGFDGERARLALLLLPKYHFGGDQNEDARS